LSTPFKIPYLMRIVGVGGVFSSTLFLSRISSSSFSFFSSSTFSLFSLNDLSYSFLSSSSLSLLPFSSFSLSLLSFSSFSIYFHLYLIRNHLSWGKRMKDKFLFLLIEGDFVRKTIMDSLSFKMPRSS